MEHLQAGINNNFYLGKINTSDHHFCKSLVLLYFVVMQSEEGEIEVREDLVYEA